MLGHGFRSWGIIGLFSSGVEVPWTWKLKNTCIILTEKPRNRWCSQVQILKQQGENPVWNRDQDVLQKQKQFLENKYYRNV